jgi:hypothetical protein
MEKTDKRKEQLRQAQIRYRRKHSTKQTVADPQQEEVKAEVEKPTPISYTVEYRKNYYKAYYEKHKEKLLARSKERYVKKEKECGKPE